MIKDLQIINQLFEMQQKIDQEGLSGGFERNFNRLFSIFEQEGYIIRNPTNESYTPSRTDCEASITGDPSSSMRIVKTIKPVIYHNRDGVVKLAQKAVVMVGSIA